MLLCKCEPQLCYRNYVSYHSLVHITTLYFQTPLVANDDHTEVPVYEYPLVNDVLKK